MNVYNIFQFSMFVSVFSVNAQLWNGKYPIDFGKKFIDGKRILGDGKTIDGLVFGISMSFISIYIAYVIGLVTVDLYVAFMLVVGSAIGDIVNSFVKRRFSIRRGESFIGDRLNASVGGIVFTYAFIGNEMFRFISVLGIVLVVVFVFIGHVIMSYIAYKVNMKRCW